MSGLLRRLADVAAGRGQPPVRSASRAAFAGAPMLLTPESGMEGPASAAAPEPLQPPRMSPRAPAAAPPGRAEAPVTGDVSAPRRLRREQPPSSDVDESAGRGTTARVEAQAPGRPATGVAVSDEAWPAPLMPATPRAEAPATGALRGIVVTPPAVSGPRAGEASEVHVTIGRIEVTAVHEPAPPRRAAKAARPLTSLDDYLRQRQGGR